jgi:hypothetical protein
MKTVRKMISSGVRADLDTENRGEDIGGEARATVAKPAVSGLTREGGIGK